MTTRCEGVMTRGMEKGEGRRGEGNKVSEGTRKGGE